MHEIKMRLIWSFGQDVPDYSIKTMANTQHKCSTVK